MLRYFFKERYNHFSHIVFILKKKSEWPKSTKWLRTERQHTCTVAAVVLALRVVTRLVTVSVIDPGGGTAFLTAGHGPRQVDALSCGLGVEILGPHLLTKHHVVIHVNELLRESRDPMDVGLYGRRTESWKVGLVWENFLSIYNQKYTVLFVHINHGLYLQLQYMSSNYNSKLLFNVTESNKNEYWICMHTSWVTIETLGFSKSNQWGICPLVTMKMCLTQGANFSTDLKEYLSSSLSSNLLLEISSSRLNYKYLSDIVMNANYIVPNRDIWNVDVHCIYLSYGEGNFYRNKLYLENTGTSFCINHVKPFQIIVTTGI